MAEDSINMFVNTCPACERQERYFNELNSQRADSLREQRILQEQQEEQQQEQEREEDERAEALVAAQKEVADEIKKTRETDTFFKQREYAEKGDCIAQNYIGWAFENGIGTKQDINAAISWWRKAEKNGSADAGEKLQSMYFKWLKEANEGDDNAAVWLVWALENGVGTKQDINAAANWTKKIQEKKEKRAKVLAEAAAAEAAAKHAEAAAKHAEAAAKHAAADKKRRQELEWATNLKLADDGNSDAQFYIGSRSNSPHKENYLRKAAEQGHPAAQLLLAQWLSNEFLGKKYGLDDTSLSIPPIKLLVVIHDADKIIGWYKKYKSSHQDYNITENIKKIEAHLADVLLKNINKTKEDIKNAKESFEGTAKLFEICAVVLPFCIFILAKFSDLIIAISVGALSVFLALTLYPKGSYLLKFSDPLSKNFHSGPSLTERLRILENAYALRYPLASPAFAFTFV